MVTSSSAIHKQRGSIPQRESQLVGIEVPNASNSKVIDDRIQMCKLVPLRQMLWQHECQIQHMGLWRTCISAFQPPIRCFSHSLDQHRSIVVLCILVHCIKSLRIPIGHTFRRAQDGNGYCERIARNEFSG
jgi:hypothetical protein